MTGSLLAFSRDAWRHELITTRLWLPSMTSMAPVTPVLYMYHRVSNAACIHGKHLLPPHIDVQEVTQRERER